MQLDRQKDRHTNRQAGRQLYRQIGRQTGKQTTVSGLTGWIFLYCSFLQILKIKLLSKQEQVIKTRVDIRYTAYKLLVIISWLGVPYYDSDQRFLGKFVS